MMPAEYPFGAAERPVCLPIGTRESCKMTTAAGLRKGHDVGYFKAGHGADGCAGAMAYDIGSDDSPGQWYGDGLMS